MERPIMEALTSCLPAVKAARSKAKKADSKKANDKKSKPTGR
ncbi:hypothetical protein [Pontibacter rugosus]|uniref:Uncharacterized protein n=1 Tax=Pontibacter rugosus TaxID=1745966 RepID=A0ABW3STC6_9BACT